MKKVEDACRLALEYKSRILVSLRLLMRKHHYFSCQSIIHLLARFSVVSCVHTLPEQWLIPKPILCNKVSFRGQIQFEP